MNEQAAAVGAGGRRWEDVSFSTRMENPEADKHDEGQRNADPQPDEKRVACWSMHGVTSKGKNFHIMGMYTDFLETVCLAKGIIPPLGAR